MTTEVLGTLLGVQVVVIALIVRTLWRLQDRVARLEGRFNGRRDR